MKKVLIGFSGNPEYTIEQHWKRFVSHKKNLSRKTERGIGGTSVDWSIALKRLGAPVYCRLLLSVGCEDGDPMRFMLTNRLEREGLDFHTFPVLDFTHFGFIQLFTDVKKTRINSIKGEYLSYPIEEVKQQVEAFDPVSCIATGVMPDDVPLVHALFSRPGYHVLNPRDEAFTDDRINEVLPHTSLLIINDLEMSALLNVPYPTVPKPALSEKILSLGPSEVIVTCGKKGSYYCNREGSFIFQPIVDSDGPKHDATGIGDTFAAAFFTKKMEDNVPVEQALQFASCAASLKLTRHNGGNAPHRDEVDRLFEATFATRLIQFPKRESS